MALAGKSELLHVHILPHHARFLMRHFIKKIQTAYRLIYSQS